MAEALGFAASIMAIIQLTAKAASLGYGYISGVKRASDDLHQLVDELNLLNKVLAILQKVADSNSQFETLGIFNQPTVTGKLPLQTCETDLRRLIAKLEPGEGLGRVANSLKWPFREKEVLQHIEKIERHKEMFMLALNVDHILLSKDIKIDVQEIRAGAQVTATDIQGIKRKFTELDTWTQKENVFRISKRRKKVIQWIYPGVIDKKHNDITKRRRKNTGGWILRDPQFLEWTKENTIKRLLWAYGIPGAGKTFLSSVVIDHLLSQTRTEDYGVAYIYFDYKERSQQEPTSVLASLVKQLANQIKTLPKEIEDVYDKLGGGTTPSIKELFPALLAASKSFSRTFIVCDALDECNQKAQRNDLLPLFHQMAGAGIHLFITSRPHPEDINDSFKHSAKIELWARGEDIKSYIEQKIDEHPRARVLVDRGNCKDKIISELIKCAKGMFLLVHFHIEYLCQQPTIKKILAELEKLKRSSSEDDNPLKPTYDRAIGILLAQPKSCVELATRILSWLVRAQRTLTVRELQLAVSVDQECTTFDEMGIPERNTLLDVCASLVIIDGKSGTVKLAHYTVQEYLLKSFIPEDAEFRLAMACTTFLSYDIFSQGACITRSSFAIRKKLYPFLSYAAAWLSTHLVACNEALTTEIVLRFLGNLGNISSYLEALYSPSYLPSYNSSGYSPGTLGLFGPSPEEQVPLHVAAALGHCSAVRSLLVKGADIEARDNSGKTVLYRTVLSENTLLRQPTDTGRIQMIELLLEKGADTEARDSSGRTVLHEAIDRELRQGSTTITRLLLEKGADIEARDSSGRTALHEAAGGYESIDIVRLLLEKGADIEARDNSGRTALYKAASRGYESAVQLLLEKGADIEARDNSGRTALHKAAGGSIDIVRLLLEKGADIEARDSSGRTALHEAASKGYESIDMARLLLEKGADIEARDSSGRTALHEAAGGYESIDIVRLLLEKGADIEARDNSGRTALYKAESRGYRLRAMVRLLLEKGADIKARDNSGRTALHEAASKGYEPTVQLLLEKGADTEARGSSGGTALHEAAASEGYRSIGIVRLLLEGGADIEARDNSGRTALHEAAAPKGYESIDMVRLLLEKGADIEARDSSGRTVLHEAASKGYEPTVQLLLEKGADTEARGSSGGTALHEAAASEGYRSIGIVRLLLEGGADIEARDNSGRTALYEAAAPKGYESIDMVRLLLEKGADIEARDSSGRTVLHEAASKGYGSRAMVQLLLGKGADIEARDNSGRTALHEAASKGYESTVQLLLEKGADIEAIDDLGESVFNKAKHSPELIQLVKTPVNTMNPL